MNRIPNHRYGEAIGEALDRIPVGIRERLGHVQFLCGVDPVFAGLHRYGNTEDGRSYRQEAHCAWRMHIVGPASVRTTTIVLPTVRAPQVIVHELGHAFHEAIGFNHTPMPVTAYAATNRWEAFAEAFTGWLHWNYSDPGYPDVYEDAETIALFESLAA